MDRVYFLSSDACLDVLLSHFGLHLVDLVLQLFYFCLFALKHLFGLSQFFLFFVFLSLKHLYSLLVILVQLFEELYLVFDLIETLFSYLYSTNATS